MSKPQLTNAPLTRDLVLLACPECSAPAEIEWSDWLPSTDGPIEHVKIRCVQRHWFLLPTP